MTRKAHVVMTLLTLVACGGPDLSRVPAAGTACSCEHVGAYWYVDDEFTGERQTLEVCRENQNLPAPTCTYGTKLDAGLPPCEGVTVYLGMPDCTWQAPPSGPTAAGFCETGCPRPSPP